MKSLLVILLIISGCANAKDKEATKKMVFTHLECKQKILPLKVEYKNEQGTLTIHLKAEADINQLKVVSLRGIDGLQLISSQKPSVTDLKRDDSTEIIADIKKPDGLSYLVLDLEGKVRGQLKKQTIVVPFGEKIKVQKAQKNSTQSTENKKKIMMIESEDQ